MKLLKLDKNTKKYYITENGDIFDEDGNKKEKGGLLGLLFIHSVYQVNYPYILKYLSFSYSKRNVFR